MADAPLLAHVLRARRVVMAAEPALGLAEVLGGADVPVRRRVPQAALGAVDALVHRTAVAELEPLAHVLLELVRADVVGRRTRECDAPRADGDGLQLGRLLPPLVRAVPHLPVGDPLWRDGLAHRLVPASVLPQLVPLADVPRAAGRVPHHDVGHADHLVDAAPRDDAQLHAPVLAQLVLQQVVGRRSDDDDATCGRDRDALDVALLAVLPHLLGRAPHLPRPLDVLRRHGVRLDLQPAAALAKLLTLTHVPGGPVGPVREPEHVVGVVVLQKGRAPILGAARSAAPHSAR
eukprot:scaffold129196_cov69-Phaeocystis_antarctica.AAC.5